MPSHSAKRAPIHGSDGRFKGVDFAGYLVHIKYVAREIGGLNEEKKATHDRGSSFD